VSGPVEETICRKTVIGLWLALPRLSRQHSPMIRLDNISKQNGHQILFIDASMGLQKGEKAGLVGPNGAGKTTLFRMIAGRNSPTTAR
jgi:ABC-type Fe3+/spermidine/putrescine transport system ATPase subunit